MRMSKPPERMVQDMIGKFWNSFPYQWIATICSQTVQSTMLLNYIFLSTMLLNYIFLGHCFFHSSQQVMKHSVFYVDKFDVEWLLVYGMVYGLYWYKHRSHS